MTTIGLKLKEVRKSKGCSQEELSFRTNVSLRTIQRIEKSENEPRGKTLQLLCKALEVNVEDLLDYGKQEDAGVLRMLYLSVLIGIVLPLGNIIGPALFWALKKDKYQEVENVGKHILVFQVVYAVVTALLVGSWTLGKILQYKYSYILLVLFFLVSVYNYGTAIYGGINIMYKKKLYYYFSYNLRRENNAL